ncbi:MAG TPA: carbohydrate kinase family protein [Bryobacteraceae bacterium]|nr:carbohydrate kinase family protein [Bryobacteraceae bacterium]
MSRALFIGDLNVDVMMGGMESLPVVDREVACQSYDVVMGASTVLCACAYASLGGEAAFAGLAGRDDYGDFMLRGLADFGIDTSLVRRTDKVRTGVTVNLIYRSTRTQVTYPGTIAEFSGEGLEEAVLAGFRHIHFGGVYLQHNFRHRIAGLLEAAGRLGISSSLDPQWDASERWEYMDQWLPRLTWLFLNDDEARSLTGARTSEEAVLALAGRTRCPLVKTGERGALVCGHGTVQRVPARRVEVVDTTGAGDSFDAGFLYATLVRGMPAAEAAAFANAVAGRSCTFVGGVNARSSFSDIQRFIETNPVREA